MNKYINKRIVDNSWNFSKADTKEYTHCYHNYPAMMIPQVARRLIKEYSTIHTKLLFDPYCGSGTSLVEAKLKGIDSIGTDLNPLARLLSVSKTQRYNISEVENEFNRIASKMYQYNFQDNEMFELPKFDNIEFWFSETVIQKLSYMVHEIKKIPEHIRDFFWVCLSETVREASYTRNSEFKLFRIPEKQRDTFKVDPFDLFYKKYHRNYKGLVEFCSIANGASVNVEAFNTSEGIPEHMKESSVDIIVTSPPYGDSRTTVAYGQFSRLSNEWLGFNEPKGVDKILMGGDTKKQGKIISNIANKIVEEIAEIDSKRANEVAVFLIDYQESIENVAKLLKSEAYACYVVGNRTVKGVNIPLDTITADLFEKNNCKHIKTIVREIPNKRMPKRNSPTNETGKTASTMNNEFIVVCQKC